MWDRKIIDGKKAYANLLRTVLSLDPKYNEKLYLSQGTDFADASQKVHEKINSFKSEISEFSILALVILWANSIQQTGNFDCRQIEMMNELIEKKLIFSKRFKSNHTLTLSDFSEADGSHIEAIRSFKDWSLEKRENYVSFYIDFIQWLSKASFGYIPEAFDVDRALTHGRLLKFEIYIKILCCLSLRERIIAKLCYLGGSRPMEDIFSLKIENIDFSKLTLKLAEEFVSYPKHVLEDLKEHIDSRKKGLVFINREGNSVDVTVPYRALKTAVHKLDLDKSFTFKDFMKSS